MASSHDVTHQKKGVAEGHACCFAASLSPYYHGTSLRTPFFFLLVDSLASPWFPESVVLAASVLLAV
jgi:hypothetical protein